MYRSVCLLILFVHATLAAASTLPRWEVGTTWGLKCQYLQSILSKQKGAPLSWSEPVEFVYRVAAKRVEAGATRYTILARPRGKAQFATCFVLVEKDGQLALTRAEDRMLQAGTVVKKPLPVQSGAPSISQGSMIPIDLPVFPLAQPAPFRFTESAGGMQFQITRTQLSFSAPGPCKDLEGSAVRFEVPVRPASLRAVTVEEQPSGRKMLQYWSDDQPWAVFCQSCSTRSWLIEI